MGAQGHVFLVGFMGAGKTTVGRLLAEKTKRPFIDCDQRIEAAAGSTIPEIFACDGEEAFRDMESAMLTSISEASPAVVACGGGAVLRESNRDLMKKAGRVVHLEVTSEAVAMRTGDASGRPLLAGLSAAAMESLLGRRRALYESAADLTVDTSDKTPHQVVSEIMRKLGGLS